MGPKWIVAITPTLGFLMLLVLCNICTWCWSQAEEVKPKVASIGVETRNPTEEEAKAYGLGKHEAGCTNGEYLKAVEKGGPAEKADLNWRP